MFKNAKITGKEDIYSLEVSLIDDEGKNRKACTFVTLPGATGTNTSERTDLPHAPPAEIPSGPITSRQIDGETMETARDFIFSGSKITADGDCSHEIKRYLLLGRKAMPNLDSILESSDITSPTKVRLVKAMVFPVVMYGCESWTLRKAEH